MMAADEPTDRPPCDDPECCDGPYVVVNEPMDRWLRISEKRFRELEAVLTAARTFCANYGLTDGHIQTATYEALERAVRAADAHSPQNATKSTETADTPAPNPEDQ